MFVLLSLPHTGTTFTASFLEGTPGVDGRINLEAMGDGSPPDGLYVLLMHFRPETWLYAAPWCRRFRPVMPMRDPLLTAISHEIRASDMDVGNWARAATVMDAHVAEYLPLDLLTTEKERVGALRKVLRSRGLERGGPIKHCMRWARDWDEISGKKGESNTSGAHPLKALYEAGDFEALQKVMPDKIAALQEHERSLRPWLERMGYRDLMWWS